ncbi:hypothetical protein A33Q_1358 [Indibacter alkaliphilus LW1]|uniref:CAAX protease self-immunity n=1 Tax=Indibacter alkaliphilus (strain CCUG 57479 / KCTC 22604 / LW1) TaxID=1189612 RepID=S2DI73_INDAL|nr:hypothetical protein A33Q_1358 [Indibacter alkaliphilus LW1]
MIKLFKSEFIYISGIPTLNFLKRAPTNWFQSVLLVTLVYGSIDILLSFSSWELIVKLFPVIEEADWDITELGFWDAAFSAIIIAPLFEEPVFRLILKFSKTRWNISFLLLIFMSIAVSKYLFFAGLIIWAIVGIKLIDRYFYSKFLFTFLKFKKFIFWFIALSFGFIHLGNFDLEMLPMYLYVPAVLPQLIGGVLLGIVRIRFGFWYAVLLHAYTNGCAIFMTFYWG